MLDAVFHWAVLAYYLCADATMIHGLINAHALRGRPEDDPTTNRIVYGAHTYITIWNLIIQQVYFGMCCYDHLLSKPDEEKHSPSKKRKLMFRSVLFPTTCVVSTIYWWWYWKSPFLIFGDLLNEIYPWWVDHVMHTLIVPIATAELFLVYSPSTEKDNQGEYNVKGLMVYNAFITFYAAVVIVVRVIRGVWPYPFLDPANNGNPFYFFVSLYALGWMWYLVGLRLPQKFRGGDQTRTAKKLHSH